MSAAQWGAMLKRMRLVHVFSNASGLTISLRAEIHKHTHMRKEYCACKHRIIYDISFPLMMKVLEDNLIVLNVTCKLTVVAVGSPGGWRYREITFCGDCLSIKCEAPTVTSETAVPTLGR